MRLLLQVPLRISIKWIHEQNRRTSNLERRVLQRWDHLRTPHNHIFTCPSGADLGLLVKTRDAESCHFCVSKTYTEHNLQKQVMPLKIKAGKYKFQHVPFKNWNEWDIWENVSIYLDTCKGLPRLILSLN